MIVVAGGGPAGSAAAIGLARGGLPVTVIERETAPVHRICGEFLGGDALRELRSLGVDVFALGGVPISRLRLVRREIVAETRLPFAAAGIERRTLDEALLDTAAGAGAAVLRGRAVREVRGAALDVEGLGEVRGSALMLATGKHDARGARRKLRRPPAPLVGFKVHAVLEPRQASALAGAVELVLFRDSYAGLQMVGRQTANLCLLADAGRLARSGGGWPGLLADLCAESPHLARRLRDADLWARPLAIARVPYGYRYRPASEPCPAQFRLGDQMAVIASFTGSGMGVAFVTARMAAACLIAGGTARDYHDQAARALARPVQLAGAVYAAGRVPWAQAAIATAAQAWPPLLGLLGRLTRVAPDTCPR